MLKTEVFLSFLLILMGSIDCLTTVIGVLYSGAAELNPFMAGIVSTNIGVFLLMKIAATILIAFTYILANRTLMKTQNKTSRSFKYSYKLLKVAYSGIIVFLVIVVANNLLILMR
ncbi:MAG: DUF5658 family protein [Candidatus Bathyarchaeia archaeon]|jgi:membrane protein DedA with SNARE-associated domain